MGTELGTGPWDHGTTKFSGDEVQCAKYCLLFTMVQYGLNGLVTSYDI
jgi:hypothetical protein